MPSTTTVILGAGFGGIATANALRRLLPPEHRVVLVDKTSSFHFGATKPWVMLGHKTIEEVCHGLEGLTARGIELVRAEIRRIDVAGGAVTTAQGSLRGDYLVVALGSDYDMGLVPGLEAAAYEFYSLAGAARLDVAGPGSAERLRGPREYLRGDLAGHGRPLGIRDGARLGEHERHLGLVPSR